MNNFYKIVFFLFLFNNIFQFVFSMNDDEIVDQKITSQSKEILIKKKKSRKRKSKDEKICAICFKNLENKDRASLHCHENHVFCLKCITTWAMEPNIRGNPTCPMCRSSITVFGKNNLDLLDTIDDIADQVSKIKKMKQILRILKNGCFVLSVFNLSFFLFYIYVYFNSFLGSATSLQNQHYFDTFPVLQQ